MRFLDSAAKRATLGLVLAASLTPCYTTRADALSISPAGSPWVETWAASPQQIVDPFAGGSPVIFNNQTIRQTVRISTGGQALRIRLTNEYGGWPVGFGDVHVALSDGQGGIVPGSDRVVTFSGSGSVEIPASAPGVSDPIPLPVASLSSLVISLYVPINGNAGAATPHLLGQQTSYIAPGDQAGAPALSGAAATTVRFFLSGVDVLINQPAATLVTLGDSITDGFSSSVDANHRWPDYLAQVMQNSIVLSGVAVANEGINGNRLLSDGFGPSAISRFDRDVLSRPGLRFVAVLEGINDIGNPDPKLLAPGTSEPTPSQLIAGYRQLIARAHEHGVLIFGCTLTPFQGSSYYTDAGEAVREAVNAYIRGSGEFDGLIDFDAALRNPSNPAQLLPLYDSGDHVHPNDTGYAVMAASVNLLLFVLPPYQGP